MAWGWPHFRCSILSCLHSYLCLWMLLLWCSASSSTIVVSIEKDIGICTVSGTELTERICVMGISMNLVTYLVGDLHLSTSRSANIVTNFMGTLNLLALLGGFLADAKLGRYLTVSIFSTITAMVSLKHALNKKKNVAFCFVRSWFLSRSIFEYKLHKKIVNILHNTASKFTKSPW